MLSDELDAVKLILTTKRIHKQISTTQNWTKEPNYIAYLMAQG